MKISEEAKKRLDALKVHPKQSYDEVIRMLLNEHGRSKGVGERG
jgi:predicted CopG family antitoxin